MDGKVAELRSVFPLGSFTKVGELHPMEVIRIAESGSAGYDRLHGRGSTSDVGRPGVPFIKPRTLLTSGGLGTMGFGLPAAIGAALAHPHHRVLCLTGDGSLQMNIQELATLAELGLPVTIIVMNNGHLGLVRQQQEMFYDRNYIASRFDLNLDFAAIGRQFGLSGYQVDLGRPVRETLSKAVSEPGPNVVDISIHHMENVLPIVPPGGQ